MQLQNKLASYKTERWHYGDDLIWLHKSSQSNLGRAYRSCTTTQQSPHWLQWDAPSSPSKLHLPLRRSPPLSNTSIPRPTPLTKRHPDPLSRFATVHFPDQQTDRPTHRPTDELGNRSTWLVLTLAILLESDALKNYTVECNLAGNGDCRLLTFLLRAHTRAVLHSVISVTVVEQFRFIYIYQNSLLHFCCI